MASLQKYEGRGKHQGKTFYRIQPTLPKQPGEQESRRVTIRLGSGQKQALKACDAIGDLIDSAKASVEPSADTKAWLRDTATETVCGCLLQHDLIDALPLRFSDENTVTTISQLADEYIRTRGAGQKESTLTLYRKGRKNLIECFSDVDVTTLTKRDGREFFRWLLEDKKLAENTAKQRLRFARGFFALAVEDELIAKNPFIARGLSVSQTAAEKTYVTREAMQRVIDYSPTLEWKLLFALCRSIPTRVPSEIQELTWSDVDVEANTILIHSPKTRKIGKSARLVPILPDLKELLARAFEEAEKLEDYVFPVLRSNKNPATTAKKYVERAKVPVWPNFFNSLRASAETDLMDAFGLRKACQWAGNSPATAIKNYSLVRKTEFIDAGAGGDSSPKVDAYCAAVRPFDAQSDAEPASTAERQTPEKPTKKAPASFEKPAGALKMGAEGLEPPTLSV